jgi:hypothetical protein
MDPSQSDASRPERASADGTQIPGPQEPPAPPGAIAGEFLPATATLSDIAALHPNNFGGPVQSKLLVHLVARLERENSTSKSELEGLRKELIKGLDAQHRLEMEKAVLIARLAETRRDSSKRAISTFLGMALLGLGLDAFKNSLPIFSWPLTLVGALLLGYGLLPVGKGDAK